MQLVGKMLGRHLLFLYLGDIVEGGQHSRSPLERYGAMTDLQPQGLYRSIEAEHLLKPLFHAATIAGQINSHDVVDVAGTMVVHRFVDQDVRRGNVEDLAENGVYIAKPGILNQGYPVGDLFHEDTVPLFALPQRLLGMLHPQDSAQPFADRSQQVGLLLKKQAVLVR